MAIFIFEKAEFSVQNINQDKERHYVVSFQSLLDGIWRFLALGQPHCQVLKMNSELKQNLNILQQQIKGEKQLGYMKNATKAFDNT